MDGFNSALGEKKRAWNGKKEQAWECYTQALSIGREVEDLWGQGTALCNLGSFSLQAARYDAARAYLLKAEHCLQKIHSPDLRTVQALVEEMRAQMGEKAFESLLEGTTTFSFQPAPENAAYSWNE